MGLHCTKTNGLVLIVLLNLLLGCGGNVWTTPDLLKDINQPQNALLPLNQRTNSIRNHHSSLKDSVVVLKGDTVFAVARRYRVTPSAIIDLNKLSPPFHLVAGKRIMIPTNKLHKVKRGETLYTLAQIYNVSMYRISRINSIKPPYVILAGDTLAIPKSGIHPEERSAISGKLSANTANQISSQVSPRTGVLFDPPRKPRFHRTPKKNTKEKGKDKKSLNVNTETTQFLWPLKGRVISSFGPKKGGLHNDGINISAPSGSSVLAAKNGIVAYAGNEVRGFGNLLLIKHVGGWVTAYAHNKRLLVGRGDQVKRGQKIATVGRSGRVQEPQLHFEIRKGRHAKNPKDYL